MRTDTNAIWRCGGEWGGGEGAAARGVGERRAETADEVGDALGIVMDGHVGRAHGGMSEMSRRRRTEERELRKFYALFLGRLAEASWREKKNALQMIAIQ